MGGGASCKLKTAAMKIFVQTCGSFCHRQQTHVLRNSPHATPVLSDSANNSCLSENQRRNICCKKISSEIVRQANSSASPCSNKNLCTICLDTLSYDSGSSSAGHTVFTAQCSHQFHFACISSNVHHGSVTCPICRAHWTQLPHNLNTRCSIHNKTDPVLQILDDSIANFRVQRRSLRSARYDDDGPTEPDHTSDGPRLSLSLLSAPRTYSCPHQASYNSSSSYSMEESPLAALKHVQPNEETPIMCSTNNGVCLRVKLAHQPATDLVLVASSNGPHLRLMKQVMALAVFSLRPIDRLAIVTYSSSAACVFSLRRMTSYAKRAALQVIDRVFYMGQANPTEGLKKAVKILEDRSHRNLQTCILHLTDIPSRTYHWFDTGVPITIHRFHLGLGFGAFNGVIMHEFEEFLVRTLGGGVKDIQLRIGEGTMNRIVRIGELRGGEERNIPLCIGDQECVYVKYSYRDSGDGESIRRDEIVLGMRDKGDTSNSRDVVAIGTRMGNGENWDPFMARRWAKHLHGYGL